MNNILDSNRKNQILNSFEVKKSYVEGIYADTPQNRKLGRVGMSYASYGEKVKKDEKINTLKLKDSIYEAIQPLTKKRFRDEDWSGLYSVKDKIGEVVEQYRSKIKGLNLNISVGENGGYRQNGEDKWKEYKLEILKDNEPIITGTISCSAAGTIAHPFGSYDVTVILSTSKIDDDEAEALRNERKPATAKDLIPKMKEIREKYTKEILDKTTTLKEATGDRLDAIIEYSNSDGIDGIKVEKNASDEDKRKAIAEFYIEAGELIPMVDSPKQIIEAGGPLKHWHDSTFDRKEAAESLDEIIEDALSDYVPKKEEKSTKFEKISDLPFGEKEFRRPPLGWMRECTINGHNFTEFEKVVRRYNDGKYEVDGEAVSKTEFLKLANKYSQEKEQIKTNISQNKINKINDYFGFEDEEGEFISSPMAQIMANDKEFDTLIEKFSDFHVLSQSGSYENKGGSGVDCNVTFEVVPNGTSDEDVDLFKKKVTIDGKTTIESLFEQLNKK